MFGSQSVTVEQGFRPAPPAMREPGEELQTASRLEAAREHFVRAVEGPAWLAVVRGLRQARYQRRLLAHAQKGLEQLTFSEDEAENEQARLNWVNGVLQQEVSECRRQRQLARHERSVEWMPSKLQKKNQKSNIDKEHRSPAPFAHEPTKAELKAAAARAVGKQTSENNRANKRRLAVAATVGAFAVASIGGLFAHGAGLSGDKDSNRSGDPSAETTRVNQGNQSFQNATSMFFVAAAKQQHTNASKDSVIRDRQADEKPARVWQSVPEAPSDVWVQENTEDGTYQAYANPNNPEANSIWTLSAQVARLQAGKDVSLEKVRQLTAAVKRQRAKQGKGDMLQAKEKVSFTKGVLRALRSQA